MQCGVYCITNTANGRLYIGSAQDIKKRWKEHLWRFHKGTHSNRHLQFAWNKYGESCFVLHILELVPRQHLLMAEQKWFTVTGCCDPEVGYNISKYADAPMRGRKASLETLTKLSQAKLGRPKPPGFGALISKRLTGIKRSKKTIEKIRASKVGKPAPNRGVPMSIRQKEKLRKLRRGKLLVFFPGLPEHKLIEKNKLQKYLVNGWVRGKQGSRLALNKTCAACGTRFETHTKRETKKTCCSRSCASKIGHSKRQEQGATGIAVGS
jgi:group I intron endonuclease